MRFDSAKVIALTSGKGGVGKTLVTSELALYLSSKGKKILIIDGDVGLANVDILFSVKARGHLYQVVSGDKKLNEIVTPVAPRVDLISTGNGIRSLNHLSSLERRGLIASLIDLQYSYDFVLMDTSSGLSEFSFHIASMADMIINILTPDPASFTDSYSLIKLLNQDFKIDRFFIMTNFAQSEMNGALLFKKFAEVTGRFLILSLDYVGSLTIDNDVARSTQNQKLWIRQAPTSAHAIQIGKIGENILMQSKRLGEVSQFWTEISGVA
jgi:flagellar biosynthesis protein FlhG